MTEDDFPDPTAMVIIIRKSGDCEAFMVGELDSQQDVIDALRETAGTIELEMREENGEFNE